MKNKSSILLFSLGLFLVAFSFFVTSETALAFLHASLKQGSELNQNVWLADLRSKGMWFGAALCLAGLLRGLFGDRFLGYLEGGKSEEGRSSFDLFLVSALCLFAELLIIRWLSVEMRIFAYFKNVPLISCFLGIGLGAALGESKKPMRYQSFPFWFALFAAVVVFLGPRLIFVNPGGADEYIWGIGKTNSAATQMIATFFFIATVIFIFVWNTRIFMTLGYLVGRMLTGLEPLKAYSVNILGSLAGVLLFGGLSYLSSPPIVWFGVTLAMFLLYIRRQPRYLAVMAALAVAFLTFLSMRHDPEMTFWSPYYKIKLIPSYVKLPVAADPVLAGYALYVNEDSHQTAMNYSEEFMRMNLPPDTQNNREVLELPFRTRQPKSALIVGSGMGNDVAAALRSGVEEIDAVEIDPMILRLGKKYHPEHPYDSPKVHAINDDARSYFKKSKKKYDIVVFGILDSHTQFSNLSSLRLDNFVYTLQSFQDARKLLNPGGLISITFAGDAKVFWMGERFYGMLAEAFGREPIALDMGRMMFVSGDDLTREELMQNPYWKGSYPEKEVRYNAKAAIKSTDDWPFIYMRARQVPKLYFFMIGVLCLIAWLFLKRYLKDQQGLDLHFFLLGAAFMLLETKAVSELALVFGTTWIVNAVVFSGIMVLILLGNFVVNRLNITRTDFAYVLLAATLLFSYFFDLSQLASYTFGVKVLLSTGAVLSPLFFASIIFAVSFSKTQHIPSAFGSNLIGAVIGGFFEYASLATGIRFLAILALVFYALSYMALWRRWKFSF